MCHTNLVSTVFAKRAKLSAQRESDTKRDRLYTLLTVMADNSGMVFRFRICEFSDAADTAQGWVIASCELHARSLIGDHSFLHRMPHREGVNVPFGTIFVTNGVLAS